MPEVSMNIVIDQLLGVLREGFEGATGQWAYFTNPGPDAGLLGTLAALGPDDASRPVGGSSVAAHVHHVMLALGAATSWILGDRTVHNWEESWRVRAVDEAMWSLLREQLRKEYQALRQAVAKGAGTSPEAMGAAIGQAAHVAYHLGMIRQKAAILHES